MTADLGADKLQIRQTISVCLPLLLHAPGWVLMVPVPTRAIADMYPQQRGSASCAQAFPRLPANAAIGGAVAPWWSHSGATLAAGAATLLLLAWRCRLFECRARRALLAAAPGNARGSPHVHPVQGAPRCATAQGRA